MKKIIIRISISLFSLIFFLFLLEIGLRITGYFFTQRIAAESEAVDDAKAGIKILCIGDSYTVGGQGAEHDTYPRQLQNILVKNFNNKFNVINGGICESNSTQVLRYLSGMVRSNKPDYVILLTGSANRFNLIGYNQYAGGKKDFLANLKVYKMLRILLTNIKGEFLKWRTKQHSIEKAQEFSLSTSRLASDSESGTVGADKFLKEEMNEQLYRKKIELNPKNFWAYVGLGDCYREQRRYQEAESMYKKAIEINPNQDIIYITLGDCYRDQGKLEESEEFYKKAIELDSHNTRAYIQLGNSYRDRGVFKLAQDMYKKAMELNPQEGWAYTELGHCRQRQKRFKEAEELYLKGIELNPKEHWVYAGLGNCYRAQGKFKEAEDLYKKVIKENPKHDWVYLELGICYSKQGKFNEAERFYKQAIQLNPKNYFAYLELGDYYATQERFQEAEEVYKEGIESNPGISELYIRLGVCYDDQKKIEEAESAYKKAIEVNPKDEGAYLDLGNHYQRRKMFSQAESAYKKAMAINPGNGWIYTDLSDAYFVQGRYADGFEALCKGVEYNPEDFKIYYYMVRAYEVQSKHDSDYVLKIFEKVAKNYPDIKEHPEFINYIAFFKDRKKWENKINQWLRQDLERIVKLCQDNNIKLIIQNYPYPYPSANKALRDLAQRYSLPFVDNHSVFEELVAKEGRNKYFADYDHCTALGHAIMVKNIYKVLDSEGILANQ